MRYVLIGTLLLLGLATAVLSAFGEQLGSQAGSIEVSSGETDKSQSCGEVPARAVTASAVSAKRLIGIRVTNPIGEDIGYVRDLVVDRCGMITHLVVQVGGFMGFGGRHVRIELSKVRIKSPDQSTAMVALVRETRKHMLKRERLQDRDGD